MINSTTWKRFLIGKGYYWLNTDDDAFDAETREATIAYQVLKSLPTTGVLDVATVKAAAGDGLPIDDDLWPPRPDFPPLVYQDRIRKFGAFTYVPTPTKSSPESITIDSNWTSRNVTYVEVPQLANVPGAPTNRRVAFNVNAADQFLRLWRRWEEEGLLNKVCTWDGSWVPRFIRGSRSVLSNHAWGTAFDINAAQNPLGRRPPGIWEAGSVRELVYVANECGFYWGGHFGRTDGMHFEVATS